ncbi:hypothetical protein GCM10010269_50280 [Streptomyces humidus]|uniref:Uncharacterized protein n=1 Tax=Streptomyces humidus TaxID=52259 RepID=A0A918G060_9ACTN|nr:hypothetical protein [Streptomyces humidus]GGS05344.1 hypothetical protein GCM10010269_50280 [Streptomyces humidus]
MSDTALASAALRRTGVGPDGYTMELGLLNKGGLELTSWQSTFTMPEGASLLAREGTVVACDLGSQAYTVRPEPSTPLAPSERRTMAVEVRGTTRAPTTARFTATAADGTTVQAPLTLMATVVGDGQSREADESTWPGSTAIDRGTSGTETKPDPGEDGTGGGLGGGGGGGATTKFRVSFEWENDSGGGGGAGGGMNQESSGAATGEQRVGADQQVQAHQGAAGADGQPLTDWQQYQQKYQQGSQQTDSLDGQIKELNERVAKLEGGKP